MRVVEVGTTAVRALAVGPGGALAVACAGGPIGLYDWNTGAALVRTNLPTACAQFAFDPGGAWVAYVQPTGIFFEPVAGGAEPPDLSGRFAGGLALSPDGKLLVASQHGTQGGARLARWAVPGFRPQVGFEFWSPFERLAFSPNGQFLAAVGPGQLELRFAVSGGLDYRAWPVPPHGRGRAAFDAPAPGGFVSFSPDSATCAFGWGHEVRVLDLSTGTGREARRVETPFRAAGFAGTGHLFVTAEATGRVKLWDARDWAVRRELDWRCGPLTALGFTPDGTAAACGTADGRVVLWDVDD